MMASESGGLTPTTAGKQMSSGLRERLKRCGRYHCSPTSAKRPHLDESPLATSIPRADNPVTPSTAGKKTKKSHSVDAKGGKRLFQVCSPGENALSDRPDSQSCTEEVTLVKLRQEHDEKEQSENGVDLTRNDSRDFVLTSLSDCAVRKTSSSVPNRSEVTGQTESVDNTQCELQRLHVLHRTLQQKIQQKRETLRKLRMVKMYRTKNNLNHLEGLISKWRTVSQQTLQDLHSKLPEPKPSLTELVDHLQVDHKLVNFDPEEESFG